MVRGMAFDGEERKKQRPVDAVADQIKRWFGMKATPRQSQMDISRLKASERKGSTTAHTKGIDL